MKTSFNFVVSILLIIVNFAVPSTKIINGSRFIVVCLVLILSVIEKILSAINTGNSIKERKGDFSADIE